MTSHMDLRPFRLFSTNVFIYFDGGILRTIKCPKALMIKSMGMHLSLLLNFFLLGLTHKICFFLSIYSFIQVFFYGGLHLELVFKDLFLI